MNGRDASRRCVVGNEADAGGGKAEWKSGLGRDWIAPLDLSKVDSEEFAVGK